MKTVALIACAAQKLPHPAKAQDLYISPLFKKSLHYAHSLKPDYIFILSAKYGLLLLDQAIEPYNVTLNDMSVVDIRRWSSRVLDQLHTVIDLRKDHVIFLAGGKYRKYLIPAVSNYTVPMQGLSIGRQLHFLKGKVNQWLYQRNCRLCLTRINAVATGLKPSHSTRSPRSSRRCSIQLPVFKSRLERFLTHRPRLDSLLSPWQEPGAGAAHAKGLTFPASPCYTGHYSNRLSDRQTPATWWGRGVRARAQRAPWLVSAKDDSVVRAYATGSQGAVIF